MEYSGLIGRKMMDRYEQVRFFSDGEFLRRQQALVGKMREKGVKLLIIANPRLEGFGSWLAYDMLCDYILLDSDGLVTVVYGWDFGSGRGFAARTERRVRLKPVEEPILPNVRYAGGIDLAYVADAAGSEGRIGVVNRCALPEPLYDALTLAIHGLEMVDMRIELTMLRVVRSPEEREAIACTAGIQKKLAEALPMLLREGRFLRDVLLDLQHYAHEMGSGREEVQLFALCAGVENDGGELPKWVSALDWSTPHMPERIWKGWRALLMLEINGYGNLQLDTGRIFSMGEPHPVTVKAWEAAVKVQQFAAERLVPGMTCRRIMAESTEFAASLGWKLRPGNFCHGKGNSRTEGPDVRDAATCDIPFEEYSHLLCEPNIDYMVKPGDPPSVVLVPDTFYVTKNGGVRTNDIPLDIVVID